MNENKNLSDLQLKTIGMANDMNIKEHAKILSVPVMNDFTINTDDGKFVNTILSYSNGSGLNESLISDGSMLPNETFEKRIEMVNGNVIKYLKNLSDKNTESNIFFLKDFNATFKFKVYVQDTLIEVANELKLIRSLNAYFIEPKYNDFYQLTLSAGTFNYPVENIEVGKYLENDVLTKALIEILEIIMSNLKYNE